LGAYRIGVDIGGTFTDLVMLDEASGELRQVKLPSTPKDPSLAFMSVVNRVLQQSKVSAGRVSYLIHGTTVATNTIIEGKGAKAALIATEGFRDVLEIARQIRPRLYDIFCEKPKPLIPRRLCYGVPERIDYAGNILQPLDEDAVRTVVRESREQGVEAVAVCLLHSYINPDHEKRVGEIIKEEMPDCFVSLSSELSPEMREYFRASTTVINAILMPIMSRYLDLLETSLAERHHRQSELGRERITEGRSPFRSGKPGIGGKPRRRISGAHPGAGLGGNWGGGRKHCMGGSRRWPARRTSQRRR